MRATGRLYGSPRTQLHSFSLWPASGDRATLYGHKRLEVLAVFVNGCAFLIISAWILFEAIQRFLLPGPAQSARHTVTK
ncbi:cation transporter [Caballeronia sp. LZ024]|uniref:cation transporter n=2 Tax=unclassified Caballeronia TaxID=2646786 RepID=UPI00285504F7|nr:cation transporter [Caballeronia sp. LZ024]MDR5751342.1 cation transporter [Caballeronia sp. LZ024]MDR5844516.1 cation transporter [Caballeronia sp. LZ031]